jgi:hypothetical protein
MHLSKGTKLDKVIFESRNCVSVAMPFPRDNEVHFGKLKKAIKIASSST